MKVHFVNYADANYYEIQQNLNEYAKQSNQFDTIFAYNREWLLSTELYKTHKHILDQPRGGGYCLWKPFALLDVMNRIDDNDIVLYIDSADWFTGNIRDYLIMQMLNKDIALTDGGHIHSDWTRKDTFVLMDCDVPEYHNVIQLEAGIVVLKKTNNTIFFLNEWLRYCKDERILTEMPNQFGNNYAGFKEHRYDQSVLTNLKIRYNLYSSSEIRPYCVCNKNMPND